MTAFSVQTGTDPTGDATRSLDNASQSCGDLTSYSVDLEPGALTAQAAMASNCDPSSDSGWVHGATQLAWLIDTNDDQFIDYAIRYFVNTNGALNAEVVKISTGDTVCTGTGSFSLTTGYSAAVDPACIGSPRSMRYATEMRYDSNVAHDPSSDVITDDVAPDSNFYAGPVARQGYWIFGQEGHAYHFGVDAKDRGALKTAPNLPIVGAALSPSGGGYWMVASDGGIVAFGDASFFGSTGAIHLNQPIVGMASTPSGNGYWFIASDGGVFNYGDATFDGTPGAIALFSKPLVAIGAL